MASFIRYAIAAFFFAASVSCLALWLWTRLDSTRRLVVQHVRPPPTTTYFLLECMVGQAALNVIQDDFIGPYWRVQVAETPAEGIAHFERNLQGSGTLYAEELYDGRSHYGCPLWYASLIFALAGGGVICFRRQFSIRSAMIATTVVAALVGVAVML